MLRGEPPRVGLQLGSQVRWPGTIGGRGGGLEGGGAGGHPAPQGGRGAGYRHLYTQVRSPILDYNCAMNSSQLN